MGFIHFFVCPKNLQKPLGLSEKKINTFETSSEAANKNHEVSRDLSRRRAANPTVETEPAEFAEPPELPTAKTWRDLDLKGSVKIMLEDLCYS